MHPRHLWYLPWLLLGLLTGCDEKNNTQLVGTVERTIVELAAPVSETIAALPVSIGQHAKASTLVVQLNDEIAKAELDAAEAALQAATATQKSAQREFDRFAGLRRKKAASATQLDKARRARDEANALVAQRKAQITVAEKRLKDLSISTPLAGILDQRPFELGERVPSGVVVAVVISDEAPWVRIWLPARVVSSINAERTVDVQVEGYQESFSGRIIEIAHQPEYTPHYALTERESAHLVYRAKVLLSDAPKDLRPGLSARVTLNPA